MEGACLWSMRCPVYRWRESDLGSVTEHGKSSGNAKGKAISGNREVQNTDELEDDGSASISVEAPVMGVESRGRHG
jgi:hypothetical protein